MLTLDLQESRQETFAKWNTFHSANMWSHRAWQLWGNLWSQPESTWTVALIFPAQFHLLHPVPYKQTNGCERFRHPVAHCWVPCPPSSLLRNKGWYQASFHLTQHRKAIWLKCHFLWCLLVAEKRKNNPLPSSFPPHPTCNFWWVPTYMYPLWCFWGFL